MDVIGKYEVRRDLVPTSSALLKPAVQKEILAEVAERLKPLQGDLLAEVDPATGSLNLAAVVAKTTEIVVQQTIDIPRIAVVPTGEVTTGFHPFALDVSQLHLQPGQREIVGQMLRTNEQFTLSAEVGLREQRAEDYIVHALVDFDDVDYFTHADSAGRHDLWHGEAEAADEGYLTDLVTQRAVDAPGEGAVPPAAATPALRPKAMPRRPAPPMGALVERVKGAIARAETVEKDVAFLARD
jgi:hypothetical protein